jgi:phosphoglycerate kinase
MRPVAERLSQLIELPVQVVSDCVDKEVRDKVRLLREGEILLLENLRFHPEEEANEPHFAQELASLADIYVDDAFGTAHRIHASTVGVTKYLPAVAGFLIQKEVDCIQELLSEPSHPFACLLGGAKINDKIRLIRNILQVVDVLLIGGAMATTFLKAQGLSVGQSLVDNGSLGLARELLQETKDKNIRLLLPVDEVVVDKVERNTPSKVITISRMSSEGYIVDIGPQTCQLFCNELKKSRTVIWNGPMGVSEIAAFAKGTRYIATCLSHINSTTVIGGGSSAEVVEGMGLTERMTHVSTGGGASLKLLKGCPLPAVQVLQDKD